MTVVVGLAGRRLELVGQQGILKEGLAASGAAPPRGRAWAVFRGTEPVELSTPLSDLEGQELSALLVPELLDWCTTGSGAPGSERSDLAPFAVCGLLHPGDEVVCLWSEERLPLPQRAVRLVGGFGNCVHAVTSSGRSICVSRYGVGAPNSALCCLWASVFFGAEEYGGPSVFAQTERAAFLLCSGGCLLRCGKLCNGGWGFSKPVEGRFTQLAHSTVAAAALRDDGEVLVWSGSGSAEPQSGGKAARIWGTGGWTSPGGALLAAGGLFAADEVSATRSLADAEECSSALAALTALAQARSGSSATGPCNFVLGGEGWLFALLCDGAVLLQSCYEGLRPVAAGNELG